MEKGKRRFSGWLLAIGLVAVVIGLAVFLGISQGASKGDPRDDREEVASQDSGVERGRDNQDKRVLGLLDEELERFEIEGVGLSVGYPAGWGLDLGDPVRIVGEDMSMEIHGEANPEYLSVGEWLEKKVLVPENPVVVQERGDAEVDGLIAKTITARSEQGEFKSIYVSKFGQIIVVTVFGDFSDQGQNELTDEILGSLRAE